MLKLSSISLLGSPVTTLSLTEVTHQILDWASSHQSRIVCVADAHMLIQSRFSPEFNAILRRADIVTPDGMPLVVMLKLLGKLQQQRVAGMDLFLKLARGAALTGTSIFFVGSEARVLKRIYKRLSLEFPSLKVAGMAPLPFRPTTAREDADLMRQIRESRAGIILVALGCPKQEIWMDQHREQIRAVMVGVGGVFPVYAGLLHRAPVWVRTICMEWAFRLLQEPHRLWHRYVKVVPLFLMLALLQLLASPFSYIWSKLRDLVGGSPLKTPFAQKATKELAITGKRSRKS